MLLKNFSARTILIVATLILTTTIRSSQAQYYFRTNNGAILIESYRGLGGVVEIPAAVGGMPGFGSSFSTTRSPNRSAK